MTTTVVKASNNDKKAILRFYKQQHYSAGFLGFDHTYYIQKNAQIIASVILSKIVESNPQMLLHALVVDKQYSRQKLATTLLQHCISQHPALVCFSTDALALLYFKNSFSLIPETQISQVLQQRYRIYHQKNNKLRCFIHY
ncbi:GNAT family N-acetyltransferase [Thalassotalea piscium]|uniref:N-acetylglutamate synthase-like GNAT family acetyltransferase n=1 Tax=Thalassotalea piscium TaxID=1230533 RepID=A0A7X0NFM1_9GAMM|nr:GNAT family N-acetyltransferase [Thalassotalea piscium]MBB6542495.1 N-acetylglutamate synthase-like GNAT family acetyltransferase [Thalassotalea piscium]